VLARASTYSLVVRGPFSSAFRKNILAEIDHLFVSVFLVEFDHVLSDFTGAGVAEPSEVRGQVGFEFIHHDQQFSVIEFADGGDVGRIW